MTEPEKRQHLGSGDLALRREMSVFINCPFDRDFSDNFDAIIFSTVCCGFMPRCAVEDASTATPRIHRILHAMASSKYSIHDLSRCRGEGDANLARFNMPLELGMAMAHQFGSTDDRHEHDWLLLVPRGHLYKKYISDLAGYDPSEYDGTTAAMIPAVMSWLATRPDAVQTSTPQAVLAALSVFQTARKRLCSEWCDCVPWVDLLRTAMRVGKDAGLIPVEPSKIPAPPHVSDEASAAGIGRVPVPSEEAGIEIDSEKTLILKKMADTGDRGCTSAGMSTALPIAKVRVDYHMTELMSQGLLESTATKVNEGRVYHLSQKAREYLVLRNLL